jgi:hypothetical protein
MFHSYQTRASLYTQSSQLHDPIKILGLTVITYLDLINHKIEVLFRPH